MIEAIVILGMHRSGTSCLTGCLKNYGLHLGEVSDSNKYNRKGNQENKHVFKLNESILNFNSGTWKTPPKNNLIWAKEHEEKRNLLLKNYKLLSKPWGIKDPRMLLTYSFWEKKLPKHALIGTFRHPKAVANSLASRDHKNLVMSMELGYILWQIYNEKLILLSKKHCFPIINFDLPSKEYNEKIDILAKNNNLDNVLQNNFFDSKLKNQANHSRNDCPTHLLDLYDELLTISI